MDQNIIIVILSFLTITSTIIATFLTNELLKKFNFIYDYYDRNIGYSKVFNHFTYKGCKNYEKPSMRKLVIKSKSGEQFTVLIGLNLRILGVDGFDPFGCVTSNHHGVAVFSTFLGKGPAEFLFLSTQDDIEIYLASDDDDSIKGQPVTAYKPHWFQRLGIFG